MATVRHGRVPVPQMRAACTQPMPQAERSERDDSSSFSTSPAGTSSAMRRRRRLDRAGVAARDRAAAPAAPPVARRIRMASAQAALHPGRRRTSSTCSWPAGRASSSCSTTSRSCIELNGKPIPDSFIEGKRFAFMDSSFKDRSRCSARGGSSRGTARAGRGCRSCSRTTAKIVDDIAIVHTVATDVFNHAPAKLFMNTGSAQFGRPSMGAWVTYGIGSEAKDLPGFVVLQSGPRGPRGGAVNWGSGFLPTTYQGVPFRSSGDPIVNLTSPAGITAQRQRDTIDAVKELNLKRLVADRRRGDRDAHRSRTRWRTACRPAPRS